MQAAKAVGQRDAAAQLQKLDESIVALHWEITEGEPSKAPGKGATKAAGAGTDKPSATGDATPAPGDAADNSDGPDDADGGKAPADSQGAKESGKPGPSKAKGAAADSAASDDTLPPGLAQKRHDLAVWVEAQRHGFKPLAKPAVRWAHGKLDVRPPTKADGDVKDQIENASKVWLLGTANDKALITTENPHNAALPRLLGKVAGWVPVNALSAEDTTTWLPPDGELVGFRVWAPLDSPNDTVQLGTIAEVQGDEFTVARLSDGQKMKVKRDQLRAGRLPAGTRVLRSASPRTSRPRLWRSRRPGNRRS